MRFWPVLGALLSLLTGSLPDSLDAAIRNEEDVTETVATTSAGWGVAGDGFYVWDEDRREAEEWATELAGPAFPPRSDA